MTRSIAILATAVALCTACGRYGPPVRSAPRQPAAAAKPAAAAPAQPEALPAAIDDEEEAP